MKSSVRKSNARFNEAVPSVGSTSATLDVNRNEFTRVKSVGGRGGVTEVFVAGFGHITIARNADQNRFDVCEALRRVADAIDP